MTIAEPAGQDKPERSPGWGRGGLAGIGAKVPKSLLMIVAILLAGAAGIGLGLLIGREGARNQDKLWIEQLPAEEQGNAALMATSSSVTAKTIQTPPPAAQQAAAAAAVPYTGEVIASKSGTVYYLPTCSGVSRILPANRVTYATRAAAEAKGLKPAKNCKGL